MSNLISNRVMSITSLNICGLECSCGDESWPSLGEDLSNICHVMGAARRTSKKLLVTEYMSDGGSLIAAIYRISLPLPSNPAPASYRFLSASELLSHCTSLSPT